MTVDSSEPAGSWQRVHWAITHFLAGPRVSVLPNREDVLLEDLRVVSAGNSAFSIVSVC